MNITIERPGQTPIIVNDPTDPALRVLWDVARAKFEAGEGRAPSTKEDADRITEAYGALMRKPHGTLNHVIREICEKAPGGD